MNNENMVLRTIYLPPDLDERLREIAFHTHSSKNEVMRCAIEAFVSANPERQKAQIDKYKNSKKTDSVAAPLPTSQ
jgi:predicted transcriptional regulator